jgi:hypothetical protein
MLVTGSFEGTIDFGGGALTSTGPSDMFVAKLAADGSHVWSERFGDGASISVSAISEASDGGVLIAGGFRGTVDFGGGPLTSIESYHDIFVVKLAFDGSHIWSKQFGNTNSEAANGISATMDGGAVVVGTFTDTLDFGGGPLVSAGSTDVFVVTLASDGSHVWSKRFGGPSTDGAPAIAVTADGGAVVTGAFIGAADFGGGPLTSAGDEDVFVVKLAADGSHVWSRRFGSAGQEWGSAIAVSPGGGVLLAGELQYEGAVDFGGGPLAAVGSRDLFVVSLTADGTHVWSKRFGNVDATKIAVTPDGGAMVTGLFVGTVDLGGGPLASAGGADIYVLRLGPDGAYVSSRRFGGPGSDYGLGVAARPDGGALVDGVYQGIVDFGGGPSANSSGLGVFLLRLVSAEERAGITNVRDVPNDQGGWARVHFVHSGLDIPGASVPIVGYFVWERIDAATATSTSKAEGAIASELGGQWRTGSRIKVVPDDILAESFPPGIWEVVGSVPAIQQPEYLLRVPTAGDSSESGIQWSVFLVTAHTATPTVWFAGAPDSGYSVDNLSPPAPAPFAASYSPSGTTLHWSASAAHDFSEFRLYRGETPSFTPSVASLMTATRDTTFSDPTQIAFTYKLVAVDMHGNVSRVLSVTPNLPVATLASLASADAFADHVSLVWYVADGSGTASNVYRRLQGGDWQTVARTTPDGQGYLRYNDTDVKPGLRYGYQLGIYDAGVEVFVGEAWVTMVRQGFSLEEPSPNPAVVGRLSIAFTLPGEEPARLDVVDVTGRRVLTRVLNGIGAGRHVADFSGQSGLRPGIYLVRLFYGSRSQARRVVLLR